MEWFKFRTNWQTPIMRLSDEEAGAVLKALLTYVRTEEDQEVGGRGDIILCLMMDTLREDIRQFKADAETRRKKSLHANEVRWKKQHAGESGLSGPEDGDPGVSHEENGEKQISKNKNKKQKQSSETEKEERYTEGEKEEDWESSSVLPPAATELPVITIPLINGTDYPVYREEADGYAALYPDVNVDQELRNMKGWCQANPTRRKTKRGINAFIHSWLKKAQQEAEMKNRRPENPFLKYATGEADIGDFLL